MSVPARHPEPPPPPPPPSPAPLPRDDAQPRRPGATWWGFELVVPRDEFVLA